MDTKVTVQKQLVFDEASQTFFNEVMHRSPVSARSVLNNVLNATKDAQVLMPALLPDVYFVHQTLKSFLVCRIREIPFSSSFVLLTQEPSESGSEPSESGSEPLEGESESFNEELIFVPDLNGSGVRSSDISFTYRPQPGQSLYLVFSFDAGKVFLVARDSAGVSYHPGLPNIYPNGVICTGGASTPNMSYAWQHGLVAYYKQWLDAWLSCEFNSDLTDFQMNAIKTFCRFDSKGNSIPYQGPWTSFCSTLSLGSLASSAIDLVVEAEKKKETED